MIIVLKPKCDENDIKKVTDKIESYGLVGPGEMV